MELAWISLCDYSLKSNVGSFYYGYWIYGTFCSVPANIMLEFINALGYKDWDWLRFMVMDSRLGVGYMIIRCGGLALTSFLNSLFNYVLDIYSAPIILTNHYKYINRHYKNVKTPLYTYWYLYYFHYINSIFNIWMLNIYHTLKFIPRSQNQPSSPICPTYQICWH